MPRKKWTPKADEQITPELLRSREKRKWQIALRRYVLQDHPSAFYAPYFGLDTKTLRKWFQMQFSEGMNWGNFGEEWQFDHVISVSYFDFAEDEELKMCWNFVNLKVEPILPSKHKVRRVDVLASKAYFQTLYDQTRYLPCLNLLQKVEKIENAGLLSAEDQLAFIKDHHRHLEALAGYSTFEFELLNEGRTIDQINAEMEMMKKLKH